MKTKLGISAGLLGAAVFFLALVGGWIPTILVAGYILLFEANDWLKNCAVKAVAVITSLRSYPQSLVLFRTSSH